MFRVILFDDCQQSLFNHIYPPQNWKLCLLANCFPVNIENLIITSQLNYSQNYFAFGLNVFWEVRPFQFRGNPISNFTWTTKTAVNWSVCHWQSLQPSLIKGKTRILPLGWSLLRRPTLTDLPTNIRRGWKWLKVVHSYSQGMLKGEVSLYCWPPVWLVWISLFCK